MNDVNVYRVWYNRREKMWGIQYNGNPIVDREFGSGSNYHYYDTKSKAMTKARSMAKRHVKEFPGNKAELKIESKGGYKLTGRHLYE